MMTQITSGGLMLLMFLVSTVEAKEWRGITPLKSTRADVERLLGKPNQLGRYEIENERVNITYLEAPCNGVFGVLEKANCECLVAKDTVLKIAITYDSPVKISRLGIDKRKYERTAVSAAYRPTATYSDFTVGVVYTIRESENVVTNIDYLPSAKDCENVIRSQPPAAVNSWQGLVPLRSTRAEVEQLLGPPKSSLGETYVYDTTENIVSVSYTSDPCGVIAANPTGAATDVALKIMVSPKKLLLVRDLNLDRDKYKRIQDHHPENSVHYLNSLDGITVDAFLNDGHEEVLGIIYYATAKDRELRCHARRTP
ncbi:MAG TPA: hypothetical protein VFS76_11865 [Pyrinomonadaceae bacterium]|nr:hypothetical protein [Pyrinomonadaceae bacterium]